MPFIELTKSFDDVKEKVAVPEGTYDLTLTDAIPGNSKKGKPQIKVVLRVEDHPEARSILHYVSLPAAGDEPDKAETKMIMLKRFIQQFSLPCDGASFNTDDWAGATASGVYLLIEEGTDEDGNPTGEVFNRLRLERLVLEESSGKKRRRA